MVARGNIRGYVAYAHDIAMAGASYVLSLYLRLGDWLPYYEPDNMIQGGIAFIAIAAVVFWFMDLYRGIWRYASVNDLMAIVRAATVAVLFFLLAMFVWTRLETLPRSLPFINWFVLIALLGGPRLLYRIAKDRRFDLRAGGDRRVPVLLVGAGDAAETFIRAMGRDRNANYRVVGIVSESTGRVGRRIHHVEVLGTTDELPEAVKRLARRGDRPRRLILAMDHVDGARVRRLLDMASQLGMTLARLPRLTDFRSDVGERIEVRPVAVEDLLGRPQVPLDRAAMASLIKDRRVLITGAGGCIGSELARQVCELGPAEVGLLDSSEYNLYAVDLELSERNPSLGRQSVLADVRDRERVLRVFRDFRPNLVFHAAALKHVPLVEANVVEGVRTNVFGTVNVADACLAVGASVMVLVSTDKAVNPISVMGAGKRVAERYCQMLDLRRGDGGGTHFVTVRFGNVLGSTGSVVPLFQKQLAQGGPLTVTHPDMRRYFMTMREAVELILEASSLGSRRSDLAGKICVLDMGEPVRILDLARQVVRLAGLQPDVDVKIEITGPRPGEKLAEEVFHGGEPLFKTEYEGILLAAPRADDGSDLRRGIEELGEACLRDDGERAVARLKALVPEYKPEEERRPEAAAETRYVASL
jgi:O-antigen biosynthesis protein WbqV